MNRRTFETLSKYIAGTHKTRVIFDYPGAGACANPKTGEIHMPNEIASHNALAALALLMHEAGHIAHSGEIPERYYKDPIRKDIVNAIEDARIDIKNFNKLHNVKGFYERMYRDHKRPDPKKVGLPIKLLINQILSYEGCGRFCFKDKETRTWEKNTKRDSNNMRQLDRLQQMFYQGVSGIEYSDWKELDKAVDGIIKLLKIDKPLDQMMGDLELQGANAPGDKDGKTPASVNEKGEVLDGDGNVIGKVAGVVDKDGKAIGTGKDDNHYDGINVIDAILHPKSILEGGSMDGDRGDQIGPTALAEQTRQKFKELLNIKTKRIADDGNVLDTDNLIAYHTGDIDLLFKEELVKHEKKSKIMILMDSSGSMGSPLIDGKYRNRALVACVKAVVDILDEVIELEGVNVDYDLSAFDNDYYKLNKDTWSTDYLKRSGGTNFHGAFHQAITDLAGDNSIDGKKMIVCFTDGDVCESQLNDVKNDILTYGSDVRAMIIGIGTDPCSKMSTDIVGDNIILAEENADLVLLETIGEML
ncbi:MAG: hypothetical protein ACW99G_16895 [Candidatus Thorarchaeota archaeon]|jgi:hypothetical protein